MPRAFAPGPQPWRSEGSRAWGPFSNTWVLFHRDEGLGCWGCAWGVLTSQRVTSTLPYPAGPAAGPPSCFSLPLAGPACCARSALRAGSGEVRGTLTTWPAGSPALPSKLIRAQRPGRLSRGRGPLFSPAKSFSEC